MRCEMLKRSNRQNRQHARVYKLLYNMQMGRAHKERESQKAINLMRTLFAAIAEAANDIFKMLSWAGSCV
jgi:hypothetical protein